MEDIERKFISKFKDAKIDTKFYKYYACIQRPKCKGIIKKTINGNNFYICKRCDMNINHDLLNYNDIKDLLDKKQHKNINFAVERYQKYFCKYCIENKNIFKTEDIIQAFKKITDIKFKINKKKISIIRTNIYGNLRSNEFIELVNKLKNENEEFIIK